MTQDRTLADALAALVVDDYATAAQILRPLADRGDADAQYELANLHDSGFGVPQDDLYAAELMLKAAEQGHGKAALDLSGRYRSGRGVTQDDATAGFWLLRAADLGDLEAVCTLGEEFEGGHLGGGFNDALECYRRAADQGFAPAQANLGRMYAAGRGVPQDYVQAHMWLNLAGVNFFAIIEERDALAEKMSKDQVAEAQKLASLWHPKHPKAT